MLLTCRATVASLSPRSAAISRLLAAGRDEPQHVDLPRGQSAPGGPAGGSARVPGRHPAPRQPGELGGGVELDQRQSSSPAVPGRPAEQHPRPGRLVRAPRRLARAPRRGGAAASAELVAFGSADRAGPVRRQGIQQRRVGVGGDRRQFGARSAAASQVARREQDLARRRRAGPAAPPGSWSRPAPAGSPPRPCRSGPAPAAAGPGRAAAPGPSGWPPGRPPRPRRTGRGAGTGRPAGSGVPGRPVRAAVASAAQGVGGDVVRLDQAPRRSMISARCTWHWPR